MMVRQSHSNQGDLCVTLAKIKKGLKSVTHPCMLWLTVLSLQVIRVLGEQAQRIEQRHGMAPNNLP